MYSQIDSNKRKSWFLILIFVGLLSLVGWVYGYVVTETGSSGLIIALLISVGATLISWYAGDKIALWTNGAVELKDKNQFPTLWNVVENLSITAGIPMPRLYIVEDPSPNAFATGRDPSRASIAVTTGLLLCMDRAELEGVLAHELSHIQNYDTRLMMLVAILVGAITIIGDHLIRFGFGGHRRDKDQGGNILAIIGIVFLILSPLIGQLIRLAISRRREYLADASGSLLTRFPEGLARALEKIRDANIPMKRTSTSTNHLWISAPTSSSFSKKISSLFSTHPPIDERIKLLRKMGNAS